MEAFVGEHTVGECIDLRSIPLRHTLDDREVSWPTPGLERISCLLAHRIVMQTGSTVTDSDAADSHSSRLQEACQFSHGQPGMNNGANGLDSDSTQNPYSKIRQDETCSSHQSTTQSTFDST